MAIRQTFKYTGPDGGPAITFQAWLNSIPEADQKEYWAAQARQSAIRQDYIDRGILILDNSCPGQNAYVWRDVESAENNKPMDEVWGKYWRRYLTETGTVFEIVESEE
jgi:hypothetical protein